MQETIASLQQKIVQSFINNNLNQIYNDLNKLSCDVILHVLNENYTYFVLNKNNTLENNSIEKIQLIVNKINSGIPFAYVIQNASFYKYDFFVNENVLIPRFDTETMIDAVLKSFNKKSKVKILDLGCGSGCIGLTLLKEIEDSQAVFIDISFDALEVTKINSEKLNIKEKTTLIQSNWFDSLKDNTLFDIIVANPPYISKNDVNINSNVKKYEPHLALFAPYNGFYHYFKIFRKIKQYMNNTTAIFIEIGWQQYDTIIKIANKYSLVLKNTHKDLQGINRILEFIKK